MLGLYAANNEHLLRLKHAHAFQSQTNSSINAHDCINNVALPLLLFDSTFLCELIAQIMYNIVSI